MGSDDKCSVWLYLPTSLRTISITCNLPDRQTELIAFYIFIQFGTNDTGQN